MRESDERLRRALGTTFDSVITVTSDGLVEEWNARAEEMFGWPPEAIVGRRLIDMLVPPRARESARSVLREFASKDRSNLLNRPIDLVAVHRDGREFPVEVAITSATVSNRTVFSAFIRAGAQPST